MLYTTLEKQIHSVPEEYLDEVAEFIDYILFKVNKDKNVSVINNTSEYFGCIERKIDGLQIQRSMRDEMDYSVAID